MWDSHRCCLTMVDKAAVAAIQDGFQRKNCDRNVPASAVFNRCLYETFKKRLHFSLNCGEDRNGTVFSVALTLCFLTYLCKARMAARRKRLHLAAFCICLPRRILINASSTGRVLKIPRRVNSWSNHGRNRSEILLGRHVARTRRLCRFSRIDVHFWQPISISPD